MLANFKVIVASSAKASYAGAQESVAVAQESVASGMAHVQAQAAEGAMGAVLSKASRGAGTKVPEGSGAAAVQFANENREARDSIVQTQVEDGDTAFENESPSRAFLEQAILCACECDCSDWDDLAENGQDDGGWLRCSCISCGPPSAQGARRCLQRLSPVKTFYQHLVVRGKQPPTDTSSCSSMLTFCSPCDEKNLLELRKQAVVRARNRRKANESFTRRERSRSRDK